jgi:hypothetical protein
MASEKYIEVLRLVAAAQNGPVSDMLRNAGMNYKTIYGLSMYDLRKIAAKFHPDTELAAELWKKDIREFKILSLLIEDPSKVVKEDVLQRANEFHNIELAEQAGGYFFPLLPYATEIVMPLCQSSNEFTQASGFILAGKLAQKETDISNRQFIDYLSLALKPAPHASLPLRRAISTALRLIGRKNAVLNKEAEKITKEIAKTQTEPAKWIEEEVLFELEFYGERFNKKEED